MEGNVICVKVGVQPWRKCPEHWFCYVAKRCHGLCQFPYLCPPFVLGRLSRQKSCRFVSAGLKDSRCLSVRNLLTRKVNTSLGKKVVFYANFSSFLEAVLICLFENEDFSPQRTFLTNQNNFLVSVLSGRFNERQNHSYISPRKRVRASMQHPSEPALRPSLENTMEVSLLTMFREYFLTAARTGSIR